MEGIKAFFSQALSLYHEAPERVATDGLTFYPRAIEEEWGDEDDVDHEVRPCTANPVEQSHRPVKHQYYTTLGVGEFEAAAQFCKAVDEVANFLRQRSHMTEVVALSDRRKKFMQGVEELEVLFQAALQQRRKEID